MHEEARDWQEQWPECAAQRQWPGEAMADRAGKADPGSAAAGRPTIGRERGCAALGKTGVRRVTPSGPMLAIG